MEFITCLKAGATLYPTFEYKKPTDLLIIGHRSLHGGMEYGKFKHRTPRIPQAAYWLLN